MYYEKALVYFGIALSKFNLVPEDNAGNEVPTGLVWDAPQL